MADQNKSKNRNKKGRKGGQSSQRPNMQRDQSGMGGGMQRNENQSERDMLESDRITGDITDIRE